MNLTKIVKDQIIKIFLYLAQQNTVDPNSVMLIIEYNKGQIRIQPLVEGDEKEVLGDKEIENILID